MVFQSVQLFHSETAGVRSAEQFVGLQVGGVLTPRVSRTRPGQQLGRLQSEAVLLLDGGRARPGQEFVRLDCRPRLLSPGVAGQGATKGPVRLGGAHVVGLDGTRTSPPQQLMRFGDSILLRFQFGFAFPTARGGITWRPSKWNNS